MAWFPRLLIRLFIRVTVGLGFGIVFSGMGVGNCCKGGWLVSEVDVAYILEYNAEN